MCYDLWNSPASSPWKVDYPNHFQKKKIEQKRTAIRKIQHIIYIFLVINVLYINRFFTLIVPF